MFESATRWSRKTLDDAQDQGRDILSRASHQGREIVSRVKRTTERSRLSVPVAVVAGLAGALGIAALLRRLRSEGPVEEVTPTGREPGELNDPALAAKVKSEIFRHPEAPRDKVSVSVEEGPDRGACLLGPRGRGRGRGGQHAPPAGRRDAVEGQRPSARQGQAPGPRKVEVTRG
jgi:hypothetical protein